MIMGRIFVVQKDDGDFKVTIIIGKLVDKFECPRDFLWAITERKYNEMKNSLEMAKRL